MYDLSGMALSIRQGIGYPVRRYIPVKAACMRQGIMYQARCQISGKMSCTSQGGTYPARCHVHFKTWCAGRGMACQATHAMCFLHKKGVYYIYFSPSIDKIEVSLIIFRGVCRDEQVSD